MLAICIGVFLQSFFYITNNIILNSVLHGLINFFGMLKLKLFQIGTNEIEKIDFWSELMDTVITIIFISVFLVIPLLIFSQKKNKNLLIRFDNFS